MFKFNVQASLLINLIDLEPLDKILGGISVSKEKNAKQLNMNPIPVPMPAEKTYLQ